MYARALAELDALLPIRERAGGAKHLLEVLPALGHRRVARQPAFLLFGNVSPSADFLASNPRM